MPRARKSRVAGLRLDQGELPRSVTSYDVARLAGVTQPTVSRAMRGDRIAESTRLRVLAAAESLGYVPSDAGRSLATRRTNRVGIVVADLQNAFYRGILASFEESLSSRGLQVVLFRDQGDDVSLVNQLAAAGIDGVALTSVTLGSRQPELLVARGIPVVLLNRGIDSMRVDTCASDNVLGSELIADLLLAQGHRRVGALFGPANTSTGRDRARGFRDRLASSGVALHPRGVREVAYTYAAGYEGLMDLMRLDEPPTALFCANDLVAIGALNAAKRLGIAIPDDLTIIGYDDMEMSSWELFELTTVSQGVEQMCRTAAELLSARIEDPYREAAHVLIEPALVTRATHGVPRAGGLG